MRQLTSVVLRTYILPSLSVSARVRVSCLVVLAALSSGCAAGRSGDEADDGASYYDTNASEDDAQSKTEPERKPDDFVTIEVKNVGATGRKLKEHAAKLGGRFVEEEVETTCQPLYRHEGPRCSREAPGLWCPGLILQPTSVSSGSCKS